LIGEPGRTAYDISFPFFGFPIRVHPAFFIMPLIICSSWLQAVPDPGVLMVVATVVFFISILFHELGHSLAFKFYGISSYIVLYWMGGVAVPSGSGFGSKRALTSNGQIIVSLAGPFVNFLLGGLLIGIIYLMGGSVIYAPQGLLPMFEPNLAETTLAGNRAAFYFFHFGIFANVVWGIFNLIPVYPLDGGQAARQVFLQFDSHSGLKNSLILSMGIAILLAVVGLQGQGMFMTVFFGFMAYSNFQMLQHGGRIGRGW
jgi:Zn-dependent protease